MAVEKKKNISGTHSNNISQAAQTTASKSKSSTPQNTSQRNSYAQKVSQSFKQNQQKSTTSNRTTPTTQNRTQQAINRYNQQYASSTPYNQQGVTASVTKSAPTSAQKWEQQMRQAESQARPTQIQTKVNWGSLLPKWQSSNNSAFNQLSAQNAHVRYDEGNPVNAAVQSPSRADHLYDIQMRLADEYARPTNRQGNNTQAAFNILRNNLAQQEVVNSNPALKAISDTNRSVLAGLDNSLNGLLSIPGVAAKLAAPTAVAPLQESFNRFADSYLSHLDNADVQAALHQNNEQNGKLLGKVGEGVGGMLPSIALGGLDKAFALPTMLAGIYGNTTKQAIDALSSDGDWTQSDAMRARAYGVGHTALEGATEMMNGGLPFEMPFSIANLAGEAGEEAVSEFFDPWLDPLIDTEFGKSNDINKEYSDYLMYNSLLGALGVFTGDKEAVQSALAHGGEILDAAKIGAVTAAVLSPGATVQEYKTVQHFKQASNYFEGLEALNSAAATEAADASLRFGGDNVAARNAAQRFKQVVAQEYVGLKQFDINELKDSEIKQVKEFGKFAEETLQKVTEQAVENGMDITELDRLAEMGAKEASPEIQKLFDTSQMEVSNELNEQQFDAAKEQVQQTLSENGVDLSQEQVNKIAEDVAKDMVSYTESTAEVADEDASDILDQLRDSGQLAEEHSFEPSETEGEYSFDNAEMPEILNTNVRQQLQDQGELTPKVAETGDPVIDEGINSQDPAQFSETVKNADEATKSRIREDLAQKLGDTSDAGQNFAEGVMEEAEAEADAFKDIRDRILAEADRIMNGTNTAETKTQSDRFEGQTEADEAALSDRGYKDYAKVKLGDVIGTAEDIVNHYGLEHTYDYLQQTTPGRDISKALSEMSVGSKVRLRYQQAAIDWVRDHGYTSDIEGNVFDGDKMIGNMYDPIAENDVLKELKDFKNHEMDTVRKMEEVTSKSGLLPRMVQELEKCDPVVRTTILNESIEKLNQELADKFKGKADKFKKVTIDPLSRAEQNALIAGFSDRAQMRKFIEEETGGRWSQKKINKMLDYYFDGDLSNQQRGWIVREAVDQRMANQIPATFGEKADAWRYLMMLANPVTHVRNITGNGLMQLMTTNKNFMRYAVESMMHHFSYENILDSSSAADMNLLGYSQENMIRTLERDYNQIKNMKKADKVKWLTEHGYSGDLLKRMSRASGDFENIMATVTGNRWSRRLAHNLKMDGITMQNGQLFDQNGNRFDGFDQYAKDAWNQSRKQWMEQTDFHVRDANGRRSRAGAYFRSAADAPLYAIAEQYELDHNPFGSEETKYAITSGEKGSLKNRLYSKRHFFSDNNIFGRGTNALIDFNTRMMSDIEDTKWFTRPRYQASFVQELKTQGYTVEDGHLVKDGQALTEAQQTAVLDQISNKAQNEAEQSTYHDASALAEKLSEMRQQGGMTKAFLDAVVPFTTTPINIGKRIIEYSPVGLIKSLTYGTAQVQKGNWSADQFMDNIAKGMTGSQMAAIGAWLFSQGLLVPKDDDDQTEQSYKRGLGIQEYALKIGDNYYSLDQLAPTSTAFIFGAQLMETIGDMKSGDKQGTALASEMLGDALNVIDPMMDMSMLSSVNDMLENSNSIPDLGANAIASYIGQYTPTGGQRLNQILMENKKSTYSKNFFENVWNKSAMKTPFLPILLDAYDAKHGTDFGLPDSITRQGEVQKNVGVFDDSDNAAVRMAGRAVTNILSPGNLTHDKTTPYDEELMRLYEATGQDVLPKTAQIKDSTGKIHDMTSSEKEQYEKQYFGRYRDAMMEFMDSDTYKELSQMENQTEADAIKANILFQLQRHESNMISADYFSKVSPESYNMYQSDKACELMNDLGLPKWQYYYLKQIDYDKDSAGENIMNSKQMRVRQSLEAAGVYDEMIDAYKDGKISLSDVGLNSYVAKWTPDRFAYNLNLLENGQYNPSSGTKTDQREAFSTDVAKNEKDEETAKSIGMTADQFYSVKDVKSDYGDDGKAISYSQDMNARQAAMDNGSWAKIQKAIADGDMTIDEASKLTGIGKTVLKWSDAQFEACYSALQDGSWTNDTAKDIIKATKGASGSSSSRSGKRSGKRSSGRRSSGRRSSGRRSSGGGRSSGGSSSGEALDADTALKNYIKFMSKAMPSTRTSGSSGIKASINDAQLLSLYNQIMDRGNHYATAKKIVEKQKV